jgi:hypothetical protein
MIIKRFAENIEEMEKWLKDGNHCKRISNGDIYFYDKNFKKINQGIITDDVGWNGVGVNTLNTFELVEGKPLNKVLNKATRDYNMYFSGEFKVACQTITKEQARKIRDFINECLDLA